MVTLYCEETPGLKLGPGLPNSPNVIEFFEGFATIADDDPLLETKMRWVNSFGCPHIRILDVDEVPCTDPNAPKCPACGLAFATDRKLNGHILGAHRKKE